jgi:hypothetical protein
MVLVAKEKIRQDKTRIRQKKTRIRQKKTRIRQKKIKNSLIKNLIYLYYINSII